MRDCTAPLVLTTLVFLLLYYYYGMPACVLNAGVFIGGGGATGAGSGGETGWGGGLNLQFAHKPCKMPNFAKTAKRVHGDNEKELQDFSCKSYLCKGFALFEHNKITGE